MYIIYVSPGHLNNFHVCRPGVTCWQCFRACAASYVTCAVAKLSWIKAVPGPCLSIWRKPRMLPGFILQVSTILNGDCIERLRNPKLTQNCIRIVFIETRNTKKTNPNLPNGSLDTFLVPCGDLTHPNPELSPRKTGRFRVGSPARLTCFAFGLNP